LKNEEDANPTCPPAENILKPAVDINESTVSKKFIVITSFIFTFFFNILKERCS